MKKLLIVLALVVLAVPAHAQLFEALGNPNIVAGYSQLLEKPASGPRGAFMISANIAGVRIAPNLYLGGIGAAIPASVDAIATQFGNFSQLTVPGITWMPAGDKNGTFVSKLLLQVGYSYILNGDAQSRNSVYIAAGYAWNSPAYLKYRRQMKAWKAKKAASAEAGPMPSNPYDVK